MSDTTTAADVVVIGGGPAGLTAATELRRLGVASVLVLEREQSAGGIPRHSNHSGYGVRDLRTVLTGPAYARRIVESALDSGTEIRTSATVTGWADDLSLHVTSPAGRLRVDAGAVVLATGARERPRAARMVPGDRPAGVMTTGQLQSLVHLHHQRVGERAVIVGAELVSWSAVLTLREAGCATALMTTEHAQAEAYAALVRPGRSLLGVAVTRRTRVSRIIGRDRVTAVEIMHLDTGQRRTVDCDTVILTGDWIPDNELARLRGLAMDPGHLGPVVDTGLRTSRDGIFAAGNLLHPVDTADVAALDGRHVARQVRGWLDGARGERPGVRLVAEPPFTWIAPGVIRPGDVAPARNRVLMWSSDYQALPRILVCQDGRVIARRTLPWPVSPGRVFRLPWSLFDDVSADAGDVSVGLA